MKQVPLLFLGDSADIRSGLGRIGRDLACHATTLPEFRAGYLGRGGTGSRQLPFAQYNFDESKGQWGETHIARVWEDFAGRQPGVIFTIWDPSRLLWFTHPAGLPDDLRRFLTSGRFQRWGYFPVDSEGPGGRLTTAAAATISRYDRVLGYTIWGAEILGRTLGRDVNWLPHGINTDVFTPRDRKAARMAMGFGDDDLVVGMVATNQPRKDWGCAFAAMSLLRQRYPALKFWAHTDAAYAPIRYSWNMHALIADFRASDWTRLTIGGGYDDVELSYAYSACDLTILPTFGEGFGYPVVESLACGVPVVTGEYGGQAELVPDRSWLVEPIKVDGVIAGRLEGPHNCLRPVYDPRAFADVCSRVIEAKVSVEQCRASVEHLSWKLLWEGCWKKFILAGLEK